MTEEIRKIKEPEKITSYFKLETWTLSVVALSGCIYNIGMTAGPWFEGKLAQMLCDIIGGEKTFSDMVMLAFFYVGTILIVQGTRYIKRLYVRKFANHINRDMKHVLYHSLVHKKKTDLEKEQVGSLMTKAISDVDTCVEGMRKFTTEVFDTGVVMIAYLVMLLMYDWRLTLMAGAFPPVAYLIAERLKKPVSRSAAAYKESAGRLNDVTLDRVSNALTYRVYGQDGNQDVYYEKSLENYEKRAVRANIWETAMQPLYQIISMMGVVVILWFGGRNVTGSGWTAWDIAAFTTYLSCFTKLAAKSSKAAKLFNAVQKASVSWKRIRPFMQDLENQKEKGEAVCGTLKVEGAAFAYPGGPEIFHDVSFEASPGEIIGITGPVACGKSTLGRIFLGEYSYKGEILFAGKSWESLAADGESLVAYMGHQPELLSDSVRENILLGEDADVQKYLRAVCMEQEVQEMPEAEETRIGNSGVRLSGGQQARIALARTLCHKKPLIVLDDPFSAVDAKTEGELMRNLRELAGDSIVLLISHRLALFPQMNQVLWMNGGNVTVSDHAHLMQTKGEYADLYRMQTKEGGKNDEE